MALHKIVKRRWLWFAAGAVTLLVAGGFILAVLTGTSGTTEKAPVVATPTVAVQPTPTATPAPELKVTITSTKFMKYSPVWNPPDKGQNMWQIVDPKNGYPEDGGTDFLLAHACKNQGCAGDQLLLLKPGDRLDYRGEPYKVQETLTIAKTEIAKQKIWTHKPGRIVIITCLLDPATGVFNENEIIIATRVA